MDIDFKALSHFSMCISEVIELIEDDVFSSLWFQKSGEENCIEFCVNENNIEVTNVEFFTTNGDFVNFVFPLNYKHKWELKIPHSGGEIEVFSNLGDILIENEYFK